MRDTALRSVQNLERRRTGRLQKLPQSGKFHLDPSWLFLLLFCVKTKKKNCLEEIYIKFFGDLDWVFSYGLITNVSLLTFFLDKKSNKKIKPVRKGNSFSLEFSAHEPAPGTHVFARALMQDSSCVLSIVNLLRWFFDFRPSLKLETCSNRKIGAMEILLAWRS